MEVASGSHVGGFGVATAWLATRFEVALMSHGCRMRPLQLPFFILHSAFCIRPEVASGWLAAMRDFHAWPGITGLWILHSSFHRLPPSSRGRLAASHAVWERYGGSVGAMWGRSHEVVLSACG